MALYFDHANSQQTLEGGHYVRCALLSSYVYLLYCVCVLLSSYVYLLYCVCIAVSCLVCTVVSCLVCIVVVVLCVLLQLSCVYSHHLMCICCTVCVCIAAFNLDDGLLARSQYSEGPATGHLGTGFSRFPCVYKQTLRRFPTFQLPLHASHVALRT